MSTSYLPEPMDPGVRVSILLSQIGNYADPGQTIRVRVGGKVLELAMKDRHGLELPPLDDLFLAKAERAMKACQVGVSGRGALDLAHQIMADCYGTIGRFLVHTRAPR